LNIDFQFSSSPSKGPVGVVGKVFLSLFFAIFLAAGLFIAWDMGSKLQRSLQTIGWKATPCTIVSATIAEKAPYTAVVSYSYSVNERDYRGNVVKVGYKGSVDYYDAQNIVDQFSAGRQTVCRVNPANAGDAVLQTPSVFSVLQLLFPMAFVLVGAGGIYFIWRPLQSNGQIQLRHPKTIQALVCGGFFIGGLVLLGLGLSFLNRYLSARQWVAVPCTIVHSSVGSHTSSSRHGSSTTYSVDVLYRYTFNGHKLRSSRYELNNSSSSDYDDKRATSDALNKNRHQTCYVNPTDPADAVLDRGFSFVIPAMGGFSLIMLLIGGGGLWSLVNSARRDHQKKLAQLRSPERRGPADLHPQYSVRAQFLSGLVVALIWNGFVSVFVFVIVQSWLRGHGEIFPTIFISVFVLIGFGLLIQAVGKIRLLSLPAVQMKLSKHPIAMGEPIELRWQLTDSSNRIKRLQMRFARFDVSESAKHQPLRRLATAWSQDLIETEKRVEIQTGRVNFTIPASAIAAQTTAVRLWGILLIAEMDKPPQLQLEFPVQVTEGPRATR
jgi:hypothetical protein